jgi:hypothetical protein
MTSSCHRYGKDRVTDRRREALSDSCSLQKKPIGFSCATSLPIQCSKQDGMKACWQAYMLATTDNQNHFGGRLVATATSRQFYGGEKWGPIPIFRPPLKLRHPAMPRLLGGLTAASCSDVGGVGKGRDGWGCALKTCQRNCICAFSISISLEILFSVGSVIGTVLDK